MIFHYWEFSNRKRYKIGLHRTEMVQLPTVEEHKMKRYVTFKREFMND